MSRRTASRLSQPNTDAGHQELSEVLREPRQRGHATPDSHRNRNNIASISAIGPVGDRDPRGHIDQREGKAR